MAKKSGLNLGMILGGAAALLGLVAFFMLFAPNLVSEVLNVKTEYSGLETVFGAAHKSTVLGKEVETEIFKFSFLSFLPYLLALVGVAMAVLAALGKLGKIAPIVSAACFVVAAILFFIAVPTCVLNLPDKATADDISKAKEVYSLGAGVIVAGVLSIIAALANAANLVLNKK
ncbi:MAG: hypothetical protein J1G05_00030 [Clostridiales bacterium]|nr:hypothetical protein [Clostridiales bacterium]